MVVENEEEEEAGQEVQLSGRRLREEGQKETAGLSESRVREVIREEVEQAFQRHRPAPKASEKAKASERAAPQASEIPEKVEISINHSEPAPQDPTEPQPLRRKKRLAGRWI
jgi:hypothetical protein